MKKITFKIKNSKQSQWSQFAHSSSFTDAKAGMKGVANKHFWRALVGAQKELSKGFVVCQPTATEEDIASGKKIKPKQPSKIRLLNFGVDSGVGAGYELMQTKIDGKDVYRPKKKKGEKIEYDRNLVNIMNIVFGVSNIKITDLHSFVKMLELTNKHSDKRIKQVACDRFLAILFGQGGQAQFIEPNMKEDLAIKTGMYMKAVEMLKLKVSKDMDKFIDDYVKKVHKSGINESFRGFLETL
jgi:hypothetical protein